MSKTSDIISKITKLSKIDITEQEEINFIALINQLSSADDISADVLRETKLPLVIKKVIKHKKNTRKVRRASKGLIDLWKKSFSDDTAPASPKVETKKRKREDDEEIAVVKKKRVSTDKGEVSAVSKGGEGEEDVVPVVNRRKDEVPVYFKASTGDRAKNTRQEALFKMFGPPPANAIFTREELAVSLENSIADSFSNQKKLVSKFREIYSNIKDPLNQVLRDNLYDGTIEVSEIVHMSHLELANPDKQAFRKSREEWEQESRQDQTKKGGGTSIFYCGKCHQRNCNYYQLQTRSADEPMTTFVTCNECGNRWRF